ncbi:hypothetical protein FHETE_3699 [Fusarium heterosporum]|uniref:Uncharacterized protein n=1 Tax=Fusarium heterosporum TaxID=42747 RepID=A0A8H5TI01_FUSHE|nr:hypothetical protein FHETE_3699 [Fusarium heterosporum]
MSNSPAGAAPPKRRLLKPVVTGTNSAHFDSSVNDWDGKYHRLIGTATRTISFGYQFVLTDEHIEDLSLLARLVCKKITHFTFNYSDVSYDAKNDAAAVTDKGLVRLSKLLPNLRVLKLQGTRLITDDGLVSALKNFWGLRSLEVTGLTGGCSPISGEAFRVLREHVEYAPALQSLLLVNGESSKDFMKAMREMGRARPQLVVSLVSTSEEKKWGDWELRRISSHFKNGRRQGI